MAVYNTGLVHFEVDLARFYLLDSVADFHRNRSCLRVRHQSAWTQNTAQHPHLSHHVRRADDNIDIRPTGLDLLDVFIQTYVVGTGILASFSFSGVQSTRTRTCLPVP